MVKCLDSRTVACIQIATLAALDICSIHVYVRILLHIVHLTITISSALRSCAVVIIIFCKFMKEMRDNTLFYLQDYFMYI